MRFVCDRMLGTLARWMRLFGFDVLYPGEMEDSELLKLARGDDRILLTRDRKLAEGKGDVICLESDIWDEQYGQVSTHFGLKIESPMTRCSLCNEPIGEVPKKDVEGKVPERVYDLQEEFWHCPKCDKYYWKGTHWEGIEDKMEELDKN
jgi:uncharacterized protein with PIN domain